MSAPAPALEVIEDDRRLVLADHRRSFQLVFERQGESWRHAMGWLILVDDYDRFRGDYSQVLASVEADPSRHDSPDVLSPTYQDLRRESRAGAEQVLLLGQYGPHRFSAVFELRFEGGETVLDIDIADRCRKPFRALASTYAVKNVAALCAHEDRACDFVEALRQVPFFRVEAEAPADVQVRPLDFGSTLLQVSTTPALDASTHRCRYLFRWPTPPDSVDAGR